MKLISVHKKTRGMRRRARSLQLWGAHHKTLDIDSLTRNKRAYVKVRIPPFCHLHRINEREAGKKKPPYRFRKQTLHHLIEIYRAWKKQLDATKKKEPYYLKIWLGDPEFMDSQVVAALGPKMDYYEQLFTKHPEQRPFPYERAHLCFDLFAWERHVNGYHVWESDLETAEELELAHKKAFQINEYRMNGKVERSYFISAGDMWIGYMQ
ncbi:hypothetical protein [Paenibacillus dendritiformis]|uniref:hypothetical protein n=1 Tax=Paenibacillus dendritiformis TaxID=130049 RepID=UPI001BCE4202|nr:hypothetical protein [Paenibacillus dendritiformis]